MVVIGIALYFAVIPFFKKLELERQNATIEQTELNEEIIEDKNNIEE